MDLSSLGSLHVFPTTVPANKPVPGTADQNVTSPASTQHRTGQSALYKELLVLSNR